MKTAHTPGPWMIFPGGDIGSASVRRPDTVVIRSGTVKGETIANAMANARLIAASPALFDLLKEALAQSGCDGDLCAYEWHEKARHLLNEITESNP